MKIDDLSKTLKRLSDVPLEDGFRFVVVLYDDGKEVPAIVGKLHGKPHFMNEETGEPLLSAKSGLFWNSVKGWLDAKPATPDDSGTCHEFNSTIA